MEKQTNERDKHSNHLPLRPSQPCCLARQESSWDPPGDWEETATTSPQSVVPIIEVPQNISSNDAGCYERGLSQETTIDITGEAIGEGYGYGYEHQKDDGTGMSGVDGAEESSGRKERGGEGGNSIGDIGVKPSSESGLAADSTPQATACEGVRGSGGSLDQVSTSSGSEWSLDSLRELSKVRRLSFWGGGLGRFKGLRGRLFFPQRMNSEIYLRFRCRVNVM